MSRPKIIVALALSAALVAGLALSLIRGGGGSSTSSAATDTSQFFGIVQGIRLDSQDFQTMAKTGVGSDRFLLIWGSVQPKKNGPFDWGPTDSLIGSFASHGIQVVPDLWRSPPWASGPLVAPPIDRAADTKAWERFLKAAVARYGPQGTFWSTEYKKRFGSDAVPLPVHSWQIWNEPNLSKYFAPGPSATRYAKLLKVSHDAIKAQDPSAQIVLAGMPGYGDVNAWKFLDQLYAVPGIQDYFDAAALHPYAPDTKHLKGEIDRVRAVMNAHGDQATPLWITEIGWGSAPPDRFGINQGLQGQNKMLKNSFGLILSHQKEWKIGRLFWFDWRDPSPSGAVKCSFCASAGLLRYDRSPKPAYHTFQFYAGAR
ncbi:MAG: glycosyl hydrolase [Solirubrobacterales bacterium]